MHEHVSIENVCGLEPEDVVGEIEISVSTTDPAPEVTLTATYQGRLNPPEMNWVEGEIEEETSKEPTEEEINDESEDETETEAETDDETETEAETKTDDEDQEDRPVKLGSSITVVKNGIYTLCTEYEEDGIFYTLNRSVTIGNIQKPEPKQESREPEVINTPPEIESEIPSEEDPPRPTKALPAVMVKEPEEEVSEEPVAEVEEEVLSVKEEAPKEPEPIIIPTPKPELVPKKDLLTRIMLLPPVVKTVGVISAATLAGSAMIFYAWMILFQTARVMWVDERGRAHSLARAFIHRESTGFALTIRSKSLLRAERDEYKIVMPAIFAGIYRYQPVRLRFEERMYCLHVERCIDLPSQG